MISTKVLGAYAAIGTLEPTAQATWYRQLAQEWNITTFEIPLLANTPLAPELIEAFADISASLVVTLVAQWAGSGQAKPAYGLASPQESARQAALLDVISVLQQATTLIDQGITIRTIAVHTGQHLGSPIAHAIAFNQSLSALKDIMITALPDIALSVEITDSLPLDHPIAFPAAKKASLDLDALTQTLGAVNNTTPHYPVSLIVNWGRLLINGDVPLTIVRQIIASEIPLAGVILSGAAATPDGFADAHNSHLDPTSGFTATDAQTCADVLKACSDSVFFGMKCSTKKGDDQLAAAEVLKAQADLLQ